MSRGISLGEGVDLPDGYGSLETLAGDGALVDVDIMPRVPGYLTIYRGDVAVIHNEQIYTDDDKPVTLQDFLVVNTPGYLGGIVGRNPKLETLYIEEQYAGGESLNYMEVQVRGSLTTSRRTTLTVRYQPHSLAPGTLAVDEWDPGLSSPQLFALAIYAERVLDAFADGWEVRSVSQEVEDTVVGFDAARWEWLKKD